MTPFAATYPPGAPRDVAEHDDPDGDLFAAARRRTALRAEIGAASDDRIRNLGSRDFAQRQSRAQRSRTPAHRGGDLRIGVNGFASASRRVVHSAGRHLRTFHLDADDVVGRLDAGARHRFAHAIGDELDLGHRPVFFRQQGARARHADRETRLAGSRIAACGLVDEEREVRAHQSGCSADHQHRNALGDFGSGDRKPFGEQKLQRERRIAPGVTVSFGLRDDRRHVSGIDNAPVEQSRNRTHIVRAFHRNGVHFGFEHECASPPRSVAPLQARRSPAVVLPAVVFLASAMPTWSRGSSCHFPRFVMRDVTPGTAPGRARQGKAHVR